MTLFAELMGNETFGLIILPILIFIGRVSDVSLGTLRIIFISKGNRKLSPLVGFFEVIIWLLAAGQIFSNLTNVIYYIAYALGFATGNYFGLIIEQKLSLGLLSLRLFITEDPESLINTLKDQGYGLTVLGAQGRTHDVTLVIMIIRRKDLSKVFKVIRETHPQTFVTIEQVQSVKGGIFPPRERTRWELLKRRKY